MVNDNRVLGFQRLKGIHHSIGAKEGKGSKSVNIDQYDLFIYLFEGYST